MYRIIDFLFICLMFIVCHIKTIKWLGKSSTSKEEKEKRKLPFEIIDTDNSYITVNDF